MTEKVNLSNINVLAKFTFYGSVGVFAAIKLRCSYKISKLN